jgi:hypothetical protein
VFGKPREWAVPHCELCPSSWVKWSKPDRAWGSCSGRRPPVAQWRVEGDLVAPAGGERLEYMGGVALEDLRIHLADPGVLIYVLLLRA